MPKIFLSYDQQIDKLKNEKNLTTKKYKDGTRFEDIVELYYVDESLRQLLLRYLIKVENEIM